MALLSVASTLPQSSNDKTINTTITATETTTTKTMTTRTDNRSQHQQQHHQRWHLAQNNEHRQQKNHDSCRFLSIHRGQGDTTTQPIKPLSDIPPNRATTTKQRATNNNNNATINAKLIATANDANNTRVARHAIANVVID